jgi:monoterpene epsilon-lactone hydrolase
MQDLPQHIKNDGVLQELLEMLRNNELSLASAPEISRPQFEAMFSDVPYPEGLRVDFDEVGGIPGLWLHPPLSPKSKGSGTITACSNDTAEILYLHGGGYVIGSANAYSRIAAGLAMTSQLSVFIPDYRLAPEHPYPAATDDVLQAYKGMLGRGSKIVVAGDSAGGGLVMSLLLSARTAPLPQPHAALLWSPWLDLSCKLPSITENARLDPTLDKLSLLTCAKQYIGESVPSDEILHPLTADLVGLAPLLIQVGSIEILVDDALVLASNAARAHTYCQLEIWPGMPHVFQGFGFLHQAELALKNCASFISKQLV